LASEIYVANKNFLREMLLSNKHLVLENFGNFFLYHAVCQNDFEDVLMLLMLGADPNTIIEISEENYVPISSLTKNPFMLFILNRYSANI
jgi:hypothetical protein